MSSKETLRRIPRITMILVIVTLLVSSFLVPVQANQVDPPAARPSTAAPGLEQNEEVESQATSSTQTEALSALTSESTCTAVFQDGGVRLTSLQNLDGGWDWPLDDGNSASSSPLNTVGPIAMGLAHAYFHTEDSDHQAALQAAGGLLLSKTNNFSPSDGYLAAMLDQIFDGTTYVDYVTDMFYDPLADGTYDRNGAGTDYDTAGYVDLIRTARENQGIANLAAWDIAMGLVGAASVGADTAPWIAGVKAEIDELDGSAYYDVIGLAGAVYGLAFVGQDYDPTTGEHAAASSLGDLAGILASYQIDDGGFTWNKNFLNLGEDNETIQETAYAVLALNEFDRTVYWPNLQGAVDYMISVQLSTGGWKNWAGGGENNEVTGEALWAISVGLPGPITSDVSGLPNPAPVNENVLTTATVAGCATIAAAEYTLDGLSWYPMSAVDGDFGSFSEVVAANLTSPEVAGIYDLCVRGTYATGNTGPEECIMLVVYDPDGGFVTGGGWIDSPPGAMSIPSEVSLTGPLSDSGWGGDYTRDTSMVCDPNLSPVTVEGWADVSGLTDNGALLVGLLDKKWIDDGNSGFFSGAYAYLGRRGTNLRIGPSDGNAGGELNKVGANIIFDPWESVVIPFSMEIYNGQITVNYAGNEYVDTYGDVPSSLTWDEFEFGAYPGVDLWSPDGSVNYDVQFQGCAISPTGKATFGFVSKYRKGADVPEGNTEFVFKAANLNFHSSNYEWLVVTGSDYAKFKGTGTINGTGEYKFQVWAGDGDPDTFRIKIWTEDVEGETVVYDNGMDQPISGGNIVVHTKK